MWDYPGQVAVYLYYRSYSALAGFWLLTKHSTMQHNSALAGAEGFLCPVERTGIGASMIYPTCQSLRIIAQCKGLSNTVLWTQTI